MTTLGIAEGETFRMRLSGTFVPAAPYCFPIAHHDGPDGRIRTGRAKTFGSLQESFAHEPLVSCGVGVHGSDPSPHQSFWRVNPVRQRIEEGQMRGIFQGWETFLNYFE